METMNRKKAELHLYTMDISEVQVAMARLSEEDPSTETYFKEALEIAKLVRQTIKQYTEDSELKQWYSDNHSTFSTESLKHFLK